MDGVRVRHDGAADATPASKAMDKVVSFTFMGDSFVILHSFRKQNNIEQKSRGFHSKAESAALFVQLARSDF